MFYFRCFCFFSQKTAYEMRISDWSSVVCSSDLVRRRAQLALRRGARVRAARHRAARHDGLPAALPAHAGGDLMRVDPGNPLWHFRGIRAASWLFFAYLYLPIVVLIVLSFNENRLATIWSGFSTQWYGVVLANDDILRAAYNSDRKSTRLNSSH